jgi:SAM-dependent methyltransferase
LNRAEYEKLYEVEDRMWWFRGTHANLLAGFRGAAPIGSARPVLDAGCGTGGLLRRLAAALPERAVLGLDLDAGAAAMAREKSGCPVSVGSVAALPFRDAALDGVFSADVLCHAGVDEAGTLREFHRCLAPGGVVVLNLPAYPWLLSAHDRAVDNVRRYTRGRVVALLREAGFRVLRASYWNSLLFPAMVLRRKVFRSTESDVALGPAALEAIFGWVMRLETALFGRGLSFPFGGSLVAVAVKHA